METPIYLDHHSTTPLDPRVLEAMLPYFHEKFGNASSKTHSYGWEAQHAVEKARKQVALLLESTPQEIIFTSGATESLNLAIIGSLLAHNFKGHVITSNAEHKAALEACRFLEKRGTKVSYLPVDSEGRVSPESVQRAITKETKLVSFIHGNNEIGSLNPVEDIAQICDDHKVPFHIDATQSVGRQPLEAKSFHMISLSGHKIYGPKGVGVLHLRKRPRYPIEALQPGGGQEMGLRGGTLNIPGIVGLGAATEIMKTEGIKEAQQNQQLLSLFIENLKGRIKTPWKINGSLKHRLPHNLSLTFENISSAELLKLVHHKLAISTGSSCMSTAGEPSHVLLAIGLTPAEARSTIRIGIGRKTSQGDLELAAEILSLAIEKCQNKYL